LSCGYNAKLNHQSINQTQQSKGKMKVSKVVLIVVALHVLVIGGIFIFEGCSRAKAPEVAANATDETATNAAAMPSDTTAQSLTPITPAPSSLTPVAPEAPAPAARTYVVKKGDTLTKIAKAEHVTVGDLAHANKLTKTAALKINQKLAIPAKAESPVSAVAATAPVNTPADAAAPVTPAVGGSSYTVKSGDSLWKIAKANNISVAALRQANNLSNDALKVNQKLTIPAAPATAATGTPTTSAEWQPGTHSENGQTTHIVDIGESLSSIAKKYSVSVADLMKANNMSDSKRIVVSQKLVIPSAAAPAPSTTSTSAVAAPIVSPNN